MSLSFVALSIVLALQAPSASSTMQTQIPGTGRPGSPSPAGVEGTAWTLVELPDHVLDGDRVPTLTFAGGRVQGSDGCNRYTSAYTSGGDGAFRLSGPLAGTRMACRGPGGQRAGAFRTALRDARRIRIDGPRLTLLDDKGVVLVAFEEQAQELAGTTWDVTGYNNGKQAVVSVIIGTTLTLEFGADGRVSGSAGCNRFTGTYSQTNGVVAISGVAATRKMCVEPEKVMEQEAQYLQALTMGMHRRMEGARLELRDADGALAVSATRAAGR